jgi:hypothetical protein
VRSYISTGILPHSILYIPSAFITLCIYTCSSSVVCLSSSPVVLSAHTLDLMRGVLTTVPTSEVSSIVSSGRRKRRSGSRSLSNPTAFLHSLEFEWYQAAIRRGRRVVQSPFVCEQMTTIRVEWVIGGRIRKSLALVRLRLSTLGAKCHIALKDEGLCGRIVTSDDREVITGHGSDGRGSRGRSVLRV